jgi:fido (protein-threonine AMPylation protein)
MAGDPYVYPGTSVLKNLAGIRDARQLRENAIHPFRDGNGRVQREFVREVGLQAGFRINWSKVSNEQMYSASEISFNTGSSEPLAKILYDVTSPWRTSGS